METYLGQILMVVFNFAPKGWALCNGQLLPINQNQALFSLLGTYYGGDGRTNFALPNLQGRVPVHQGSNGSSNYVMGAMGGVETVALGVNNLPSHSHAANCSTTQGANVSPAGELLGSRRCIMAPRRILSSYAGYDRNSADGCDGDWDDGRQCGCFGDAAVSVPELHYCVAGDLSFAGLVQEVLVRVSTVDAYSSFWRSAIHFSTPVSRPAGDIDEDRRWLRQTDVILYDSPHEECAGIVWLESYGPHHNFFDLLHSRVAPIVVCTSGPSAVSFPAVHLAWIRMASLENQR